MVLGTQSSAVGEPQNSQELSYGEKVVGLTFNPAGDENVNKAKKLCAELIDLLQTYNEGETTKMKNEFEKQAENLILQAQMMTVKAITCKY